MTYAIRAGQYEAVIVNEGAGLASLRRSGRDLVIPHDPADRPAAFNGKVLIPWPNRIAAGTYFYDGTQYTVPITEPENNAALHGLQSWEPWDVVDWTDNAVELVVATRPTDGYPFHLQTFARYELTDEGGLSVRVRTENLGERVAPYGTGTHSYLTCNGALLDECTLLLPAAEVLEVDSNLTPTGRTAVADAGLDLTEEPIVGRLRIDHAFTGLSAEDGQWRVRLRHPESNTAVVLESDEPWVQVYSGEKLDRRGVAVEPMTCPPNAFNSGEDLILLAPGESHEHTLRIYEEA